MAAVDLNVSADGCSLASGLIVFVVLDVLNTGLIVCKVRFTSLRGTVWINAANIFKSNAI